MLLLIFKHYIYDQTPYLQGQQVNNFVDTNLHEHFNIKN